MEAYFTGLHPQLLLLSSNLPNHNFQTLTSFALSPDFNYPSPLSLIMYNEVWAEKQCKINI